MKRVRVVALLTLLSLASASCAPAPTKVYRELTQADASQVLQGFREVSRQQAVALKPGKKMSAELSPGDPVLVLKTFQTASGVLSSLARRVDRTDTLPPSSYVRADRASRAWMDASRPNASAPAPPDSAKTPDPAPETLSSEYRTYFDLYRVVIAKQGKYEITVEAKQKGSGAFRKTAIDPIVRVLTVTGDVVAEEVAKWTKVSDGFPGLPTKAVECGLAAGEYLIFVGADNSQPGSLVGYVNVTTGGTMVGRTYMPGMTYPDEVKSSAAGGYSIRLRAVGEH